jgi:hypothetical protein
MESEFSRMKHRFLPLSIAALLLTSACARPVHAQATPDEHAQHHAAPGAAPMTPGGDQPAPAGTGGMAGSQADAASAGGMGGGMGGGMAGSQPDAAAGAGAGAGMPEMMKQMMKQMGTPPRKEIYPSLMALPDEVTPEARAAIEQLAHERLGAGTALLSAGLEKLSDATSDEDYAAMQQATQQMREGLAELEAGIAGRRVLFEGKAPRNLALDWFKREMNLASPVRPEESRALFGVKPFHLFTIVLLVAFALAMVAMYFFKMRRAAALFGRVDPDTNPPPPGASPPLAGGSEPSAPQALPSAGAPAPAAPTSPATPAAATRAASAASPGASSVVPVAGGEAANGAG